MAQVCLLNLQVLLQQQFLSLNHVSRSKIPHLVLIVLTDGHHVFGVFVVNTAKDDDGGVLIHIFNAFVVLQVPNFAV